MFYIEIEDPEAGPPLATSKPKYLCRPAQPRKKTFLVESFADVVAPGAAGPDGAARVALTLAGAGTVILPFSSKTFASLAFEAAAQHKIADFSEKNWGQLAVKARALDTPAVPSGPPSVYDILERKGAAEEDDDDSFGFGYGRWRGPERGW